MLLSCSLAAFVLAGSSHATPVPPPRRDGAWEITLDVEVEGAATQPPPRTLKQCVTQDDVSGQDPVPFAPGQSPGALQGCVVSDHTVQGNRVTWSFACDAPQPVKGSGEVVYADESAYSGTIRLVREGRSMKVRFAARRLGACRP